MFLLPRLISRSSRSLAVMLAGGAAPGASSCMNKCSRVHPF